MRRHHGACRGAFRAAFYGEFTARSRASWLYCLWLQVTVEEGRGEGGKVALLLSLSQHSDESATLRRVKHLKELSIDNKRMYCGLHGYSLVIGEDLHSSRTAEWDAVKLLAQHADQYEWLLWLPLDSLFVDAASSLDSLLQSRAQLVLAQDSSGDGAGGGVLMAPLLLRGKSAWSARFLQEWWGFYADGFGGGAREALRLLLGGMHEEERAPATCTLKPNPNPCSNPHSNHSP